MSRHTIAAGMGAGKGAGGGVSSSGAGEEPASGPWDAVVVGSGFGGVMAAQALVERGLRCLVLERGGWVARGPENRSLDVPWRERDGFDRRTPYQVRGESSKRMGSFHCVGGQSVFYGGVSFRLRQEDFTGSPGGDPATAWPLTYEALEPWYDRAERLLGVVGDLSADPTDPPRRERLPPDPTPLSPVSGAVARAAARMGLSPFRLPLAINHEAEDGRRSCTACGVCDGFACAVGAKNDLATAVIPQLLRRGMALRPHTVAVDLERRGRRVTAVRCRDARTGESLRFTADRVFLAAGALGTPHLLLDAGLTDVNPAGWAVGRFLSRHCNGIIIGAMAGALDDPSAFQKQVGVHDFYRGDGGRESPEGRLGGIQQVRGTRIALSMAPLPGGMKRALLPFMDRLAGLIVMAEDEPREENGIRLDGDARDAFGRRRARVHHRHSSRDRAARRVLAGRAAAILREAGAAFTVTLPIRTFSHALGTVRMGEDPSLHPLTPDGRYRGLDNLWVTDASAFPSPGGVNPSLTIAANALRIGAGAAAGDASRLPMVAAATPSFRRTTTTPGRPPPTRIGARNNGAGSAGTASGRGREEGPGGNGRSPGGMPVLSREDDE